MKIIKLMPVLCFGLATLVGCGNDSNKSNSSKEKDVNDRVYTIEEISGTYKYSKYTEYGYTYDYTLTINSTSGLVHLKSYSFESARLGMYDESDVAKGAVTLTEKNLFIGEEKGYIQTVESKIQIHICDIDFKK